MIKRSTGSHPAERTWMVGMSGAIFQEMPLGAEKGKLKYPFPQGCDTAECAAFADRVE
jgi:hypothetical protein